MLARMDGLLPAIACLAILLGLVALGGVLGSLRSELRRLAQSQDELRRDVHGAREASLTQLHAATTGLRGEIGVAQRALAEVRASEEARAGQMARAAESLRRLESVIAGSSSRGAAGEQILARALGQLPADLLEHDVAFGSRVVEYALRLPGGRLLPIDSKWGSAAAIERLAESDAPEERRRLSEQIGRELRLRAREVGKYLDPERTFGLAVLAVPDAAHGLAPEAQAEAWHDGVLVVPYSLALPYVLALYRLALRLGAAADADRRLERLRGVEDALRAMDEEIEGRLSRGLVQVQNARDALRGRLSEAHSAASALLRGAEAEAPEVAAAD
jgi:DNA recombination protein RmuC